MSEARVVLLVVTDLLARSRLEEALRAGGARVVNARTLAPAPEGPPDEPSAVMIDLDAPGALEGLETWRSAHPDVPVTGFVSHVDTETRRRAEALGVDVVTRGQAADVARGLLR
jgi:DNA-binding NarL/FixJ family response regulator